ncbi:hypothetical protein COT72_01455 [archaeon CG10_big_fil_rev_8_21_14_0_10_43_11]|nr:MAG: hypothetical protein COT72_01455 [archaeon CG10_big_fil_rev_8_21_14_0_10_43_11]
MVRVSFVFNMHNPTWIASHAHTPCLNEEKTKHAFKEREQNHYLPFLTALAHTLETTPFRVGLSISGSLLEQAYRNDSTIIPLLSRIIDTKQAELMREPYHHSYAALYAKPDEFRAELAEHKRIVHDLLGTNTLGRVVKNPQLAYSNEIASRVRRIGNFALLSEQVPNTSPYQVYSTPRGQSTLLMRAKDLSNDLAFGYAHAAFSAKDYAAWLSAIQGRVALICVDATTFTKQTSTFFNELLEASRNYHNLLFSTPTRISRIHAREQISVPHTIAWDTIPTFERIERMKNPVHQSRNSAALSMWKNAQAHENLMQSRVVDTLQNLVDARLFEARAKTSALFFENHTRYIPDSTLFELSREALLGQNNYHTEQEHTLFENSAYFLSNLMHDEKNAELMRLEEAMRLLFGQTQDEFNMFEDSNSFLFR